MDQQIQNVIQNKLLDRAILLLFLLVLTALEWYRWAFQPPYNPLLYTLLLLGAAAWSVPRMVGAIRLVRRLRLGRDGERAVGQTLERLRELGYHTFHDLVGSDWNIDHVVVGPGGVFTVETKTHSKPVRAEAVITHDSVGLRKAGVDISDCLVQAKAQARFLTRLVGEESGRQYSVQPVVVFPGWYIESKLKRRDVWVLEPKAFLKWVRSQPRVLSDEQIRVARRIISQHVRESYSS